MTIWVLICTFGLLKAMVAMRIWIAIRVFFAVLFSRETSKQALHLLETGTASAAAPASPPAENPLSASMPPEPAKQSPAASANKTKQNAAARSEALTLLATLQREARLIDFLQESIDGYSDAQIGAAVRDVHRDAAAALERLFAMRPVASETEGATLEIPAGFDAGKFQLVGNVTGQPPFRGQLVHHGWQATRCELPVWSGSETAARIIAPTEVELK